MGKSYKSSALGTRHPGSLGQCLLHRTHYARTLFWDLPGGVLDAQERAAQVDGQCGIEAADVHLIYWAQGTCVERKLSVANGAERGDVQA